MKNPLPYLTSAYKVWLKILKLLIENALKILNAHYILSQKPNKNKNKMVLPSSFGAAHSVKTVKTMKL